MRCYYHPENEAEAGCAECGRFICTACTVEWQGHRICGICAKEIIPNVEPESEPAVVPQGDIAVSSVVEPAVMAPEQPAKSQDIVSPLPTPVTITKEASVPVQRQEKETSAVKIQQPELSYPESFSIKNIRSLFSPGANLRSSFSIVSYVVGFFMVIAIFLLPWASASGFGFNLIMLNGGLVAGCFIFAALYLGATFISYRGIRGLAHIAVALLCIICWLIFRFTIFQEISQFAISPGDMIGAGSTVFIIACVLGIVGGIMETGLISRYASRLAKSS